MKSTMFKQVFSFQHVPSYVVVVTALASYFVISLGGMQGWSGWMIFALVVLLWLPALNIELNWTYQHYGWLSLYYLLTMTQLAQLVGIAFSPNFTNAPNLELAQFGFAVWLLVGVNLLLSPYRKNRWIWLTDLIIIPHVIIHTRVASLFFLNGIPEDGVYFTFSLFGNMINIPDPRLHLWFNMLIVVALGLGFYYQLRHSHNEWLARVMPELNEEELIKATNQIEIMSVKAGDVIINQGALPDKFYIISEGEFKVTRLDKDGVDEELIRRRAGEFFGEIGLLSDLPRTATISAVTDGELLALDLETFRSIMKISSVTADNIAEVAKSRLGEMILD